MRTHNPNQPPNPNMLIQNQTNPLTQHHQTNPLTQHHQTKPLTQQTPAHRTIVLKANKQEDNTLGSRDNNFKRTMHNRVRLKLKKQYGNPLLQSDGVPRVHRFLHLKAK